MIGATAMIGAIGVIAAIDEAATGVGGNRIGIAAGHLGNRADDRPATPQEPATVVEATPPAGPTEFIAETFFAEAPPVEAVTEVAAPLESTPPVVADPDTVALGEEPGKGRRRSRSGGGRRKRGPAAEGDTAKEDADRPEDGTSDGDAEPPKPELMDSAEHRTTPRDSGPLSEPEITSPGGGGGSDDDLLFFPPPRSAPSAPAPEPKPPMPAPSPEPVVEAPRLGA